jgi:UDP-N-acetylglucosamine--N-acetylmuramyl-(pentapeptide) pyrophosphoryl-undecaprenol N-acetylglucosamine transferase
MGGGGYVAGPVGVAARLLRLPLVLTEADSHLGVANRMLAPFAKRVFLAFPIEGRGPAPGEGAARGPRGLLRRRAARKWVLSGRPVPAATGKADRAMARRRFGIGEHEGCVLIFGGSLGARRLNDAALEAFGAGSPCAVLHASGRRDVEDLRRRLDELGSPPYYHLHEYIEPFADALAAADLVVARAGGSVMELAAAGLPAVLVPFPYATADHQTSNARFIEQAGAAVVVPDSELDGPRLAREVGGLLAAPQRLGAMAKAARSVARPDAAERIADDLVALAR